MRQMATGFAVIVAISFTSCNHVVLVDEPFIERASFDDHRLAGTWTWEVSSTEPQQRGPTKLSISGPNATGEYSVEITEDGVPAQADVKFVASRVADDSDQLIVQATVSFRKQPAVILVLYATVAEERLTLRWPDSQKIGEVLKSEKVFAVIEHRSYWTTVSAEPANLLPVLKARWSDLSSKPVVLQRES